MSKEWILNAAFNRWQFNRPKYVGKLSEAIRQCSPKSLRQWKNYYYKNVRPEGGMKGSTMKEHLENVGRELYLKISENIHAEVESITEKDCIDYVKDVVIRRTFEGYITERETIYKQVSKELGLELKPAPDRWDRAYNIDFYAEIGDKLIGIQIKPITYQQFLDSHKWHEWMKKSFRKFERKESGKAFVIFSTKLPNGRKGIANPEVLQQIKAFIEDARKRQA
ncbi:MAG: MjaI family restriction endonuclease [Bacteroidia bacterium]